MNEHRFAELLALSRAGREECLGALMEGERVSLKRDARRFPAILTGAFGSSDLVQETFTRARRYFKSFQGQTCPEWRAWLKAILENRGRTLTKQVDRERAGMISLDRAGHPSWAHPTDPHPTPLTALMSDEHLRRILDSIEQLPDRSRRVVTLRIFDRLEYVEIARQVGGRATEESVRKLWERAVVKLKGTTEAMR